MLKFLFALSFSILVLMSCNTKEDKFCRCLELGKQLNELSTQALQKGVNEKTAAAIKKMAHQQKEECKEYTLRNGDELNELKAACHK